MPGNGLQPSPMGKGRSQPLQIMLALLVGGLVGCDDKAQRAAGSTSVSPASPPASSAERPPVFFAGLAPGRYLAVVFRLMIPAAAGEIQQRFTEAGRQHAAWMMAYADEHAGLPPGTPLPYHPKFGISAAEYEQLQQAYAQMKVHELERFELTLTRRAGKLAFAASGKHGFLSKLALAPTGQLHFGAIVVDQPKAAESLKGRFGTWSGHYWVHAESQRTERRLDRLEVDLGTVLATGRRFLRLDRKKSDGQALVESHDLLMWLDPQPAHVTSD